MTDKLRTSSTTQFSLRAVSRALMGCALGVTLLATGTPVRAEEDLPIDRKIYRSILEGLGLRKDGEAINYEQRAPLVIPPSRALPPPENASAALERNPAWPKDPDIARRKVEAEQERNRNVSDEREREQNPLPPDQIAPGPRPKKQARTGDGYQSPASGFGNPLSPSELGYKGNLFGNMFGKKDDESAKFTKEPPRAALTEPPPGYQTPSPDQPYGLSKVTTAPKANDYLETHGTLDGGR